MRDSAAAHAISAVLLFASLAVAARALSRQEFGEYVLIGVVVEFLGIVLDLGTRVTTIRFLSLRDYKAADVAGAAAGLWLMLGLGGGALLAALLWLAGPRVSLNVGGDVPLLAGCMFSTQYLTLRFIGLLQGLHAYRRYALVQTLSAVLRLAAITILVVGLELGLPGLLGAVALAGVVSVVLAWAVSPVRLKPTLEARILRAMFPLALPVQASGLLALVYERVDAVMLGIYHGAPSVSAYEVAYRPLNQLRGAFEAFRAVFLPHLSRLYADGEVRTAEDRLRQTLRVVSVVMTTGTVTSLACGHWMMETVFSAKYVESGSVLPVLMAGVSVGLCNYAISTALIAAGRPRVIVLPAVGEALVNILANVVLTPRFGVSGAAAASVVSRVAVNPLFLMALPKDARRKVARSFAPSLLSLCATWALSAILATASGYSAGVTGVLLLVTHVGLCFILGAVRPEDLRIVARRMVS